MKLSRSELARLALPAAACAALLLAGAALVWGTKTALGRAEAEHAAARAERVRNAERLARIAEEEREVREKLAIYRRLEARNVLGEERRLEWADAIARIRQERRLPDLRYRVERQRQISSLAGKPESVEFYASTLKVELGLLHEGDLLDFLADLRASGNAYHSIRSCWLSRTGQPASAPTLAPRLRAECDIDLITIMDRGAK
jgi:hypothetical protein